MNRREHKERQSAEQCRGCQSVWLEQCPGVGHCPATDHGHPQGALPSPGAVRRAAPPFILGPPPWKGQAHSPLDLLCASLWHPNQKTCLHPNCSTAICRDSIHFLKMCDCHATHYLPLKKDTAVLFQIPKVHLNGSSCHLQFNNEVQSKPDLKCILDACILDIKFIHMHKEIRMQQVLTSKRSALHHKKVLFSFTCNC